MNNKNNDDAMRNNEGTKVKIDYLEYMLLDNPDMGGFIYDKEAAGEALYESGEVVFEVSEAAYKKITVVSNGSSYGLYAILLSSLHYLIYKFSNNNDFTIGFLQLNQNQSMNAPSKILPLRYKLDEKNSFKEYLISLSSMIRDIIKHQKSISKNNFKELNYKTALVLDDMESISHVDNLNIDMVFYFKAKNNKLQGCVKYNSLKFEQGTILSITKHLNKYLHKVMQDLDIRLEDIDIILQEEKHCILEVFNKTDTICPVDKALNEVFEEQALKTPEAVAVADNNCSLTYRELNEKSNRLAGILIEKGISGQCVVGIMTEGSCNMAVGILAVLKAGAIYLPIDSKYPVERIKYLLKDSNAHILLVHSDSQCDDLDIERIKLDDLSSIDYSKDNIANVNKPENTAYIMYTSGTTGEPKGVMVTHKNIMRLVKNTNYVSFQQGDKILQTGALVFDASTFEIWGALLNGLELHLAGSDAILNAAKLKELLNKNRITILWLTASLFNRLVKQDADMFLGLRYLLVGGEVLSPKHINILKQRCGTVKIVNCYGPTENTTFSTCFLIDKEYKTNIPIGSPIANSKVYILDSNRRLLPIGAAGEIYVGGDGLAKGYINRPELTAEKFVDNPFCMGEKIYKTGDLGRWLNDGIIQFLGRGDNQIKLRGNRIEPGEIEHHIMSYEGVKESAIDVNGEGEDKYICAYITVERNISTQELKEHLMKRVPYYMIPDFFIQVEEIPLTANGKIDKRRLAKANINGIKKQCYVPPGTPFEHKLAGIWSDILQMEEIGMNDEFINMRGHSLKAMSAIWEIQKEFNVRLAIGTFYELSTIKNIAHYLESAEKSDYSPIKAADKREYYPASPSQKRMYILHAIEPQGIAYNLPYMWRIRGVLDVSRLEKAFAQLIERHESMRTAFHMLNDEIVQIVQHDIDYKLEVIEDDSVNLSSTAREFILPFNLQRPPLIRTKLIKSNDDEYVLFFDMHHIISDAISMEIIHREIAALYEDKEIMNNKLQYKDYCCSYEQIISADEFKRQEIYWLSVYSNDIVPLNMPIDYPRGQEAMLWGDCIYFEIYEELYEQIKSFCSQNRFTVYTVLFSAYIILLSKYAKQEEIIAGIPVAGRSHKDLESMVGLFVNTLALRNYPKRKKIVYEFVKETKENLLKAYENQDYSFDELVDKLRLQRETGRNPIFDTMFNLTNKPQIKIDGLEFVNMRLDKNTSLFDIELDGEESNYGIEFQMSFNCRLYKKQTIKNLSNDYIELIKIIINDTELKIGDII